MSACLQGHFHEEFVSTPKILLLIGNIKPLHYMPHFFFFFLSVCICVCVMFMGLSIPTNTVSLFLNVGKATPLRNLQGQIDGQTREQMETFNKFLYPLESLTTDVS